MKGKRDQILDAGEELFFIRGINDTSMEQIAEAVPVSKMTIYKYFQSKEGLLEAIIDRLLQVTHGDFKQMVKTSDNALGVLMKMAAYRKLDRISEIFIEELIREYPNIAQRLLDYQQTFVLPEFERVIFEGQQQGKIRKDISPHLLVMFLISIKKFLAQPEKLQGIASLKTASEQLLTILYQGIVAPEHKESLDFLQRKL
ncbi:TetR/AcrR family transcriptional regulator [Paenibacillus larvae]|uniref:Transcriptional regulator-like protein n=4 Tax=Paenibacillus larvae TaxID=1464 RepID=V9W6M9_9BACL|nr:TetR/AcrR family transcriptional regulator [Paenibacillus larvae]AHD06701.1 transcriptional regulator-like protein [Paenibacillus larvae subsp. larvae DSM 25430]AVF21145.1 transcriptional regulator-like protein [Paenibacillus larvae subsp. larvae]AVG13259.1 transcriptional regulator-like protein [Paenibacillus larvae subsp. larvae DSM 25430]ETK27793.1 transcriptional regulator-like protein [Paenibacillus larvae subsp. larvae DSM 25719]MCY7478318.1 TetR/AcrR family transcriptional regulator 